MNGLVDKRLCALFIMQVDFNKRLWQVFINTGFNDLKSLIYSANQKVIGSFRKVVADWHMSIYLIFNTYEKYI